MDFGHAFQDAVSRLGDALSTPEAHQAFKVALPVIGGAVGSILPGPGTAAGIALGATLAGLGAAVGEGLDASRTGQAFSPEALRKEAEAGLESGALTAATGGLFAASGLAGGAAGAVGGTAGTAGSAGVTGFGAGAGQGILKALGPGAVKAAAPGLFESFLPEVEKAAVLGLAEGLFGG